MYEPFRRIAMTATGKPSGSADDADEGEDLVPPIPDEDGPHDVPDDKVIEKTLPTKPIADDGSRPS
jgi:hypothetical protein